MTLSKGKLVKTQLHALFFWYCIGLKLGMRATVLAVETGKQMTALLVSALRYRYWRVLANTRYQYWCNYTQNVLILSLSQLHLRYEFAEIPTGVFYPVA